MVEAASATTQAVPVTESGQATRDRQNRQANRAPRSEYEAPGIRHVIVVVASRQANGHSDRAESSVIGHPTPPAHHHNSSPFFASFAPSLVACLLLSGLRFFPMLSSIALQCL